MDKLFSFLLVIGVIALVIWVFFSQGWSLLSGAFSR